MSCNEVKNISNEEIKKCTCVLQNTTGFCICQCNGSESEYTMNLEQNLKKESFNSSYSSMNKILNHSYNTSNETTTNELNCSDSNIHASDLIEVSAVASSLEDSFDKSFDIISDLSGVPSSLNRSKSDLDEVNIVECLSDLDDYLEKMDGNYISENSNELSFIIPTMTKNNSSPFERRSKLRNTTAGQTHTHKNASEHKTVSLQRTRSNKITKKSYQGDENTYKPIFCIKNENSHLPSTSELNKLELPEVAYSDSLETENTRGQLLTNEQIFQNLIDQQPNMENARPRQYGRRAERFLTYSAHLRDTTTNLMQSNCENLREIGVNATNDIPAICYNHVVMYAGSDGSTTRTSQNTAPISIESSTDSGESTAISEIIQTENTDNQENDNQTAQPIDTATAFQSLNYGFNSYWPHDYSRTFALISCTLGLFNICRFANLTITYGGNFLIQFCILSIIFGIPFLWLQMSLGGKIEAGLISMWKISPICIGVGISITLVQYFITIYSTIAVVWLIKFVQDIFIYKSSYAWSELMHRESPHYFFNITENVPYYFNVNILQRTKLLKTNVENGEFHINDRIAFYLAFLWAAIFVILCKGLKSLGRIILLLGVLPIVFLLASAVKLLCVVDIAKLLNVFGSSELDDFLVSSKTWAAAAQETFLTWGLFGASVIAVSSRTHKNSSKLALRKDAILVVLVTLVGLFLSALVGLCTIQILNDLDYIYVPGSYEVPDKYTAIFFLKSLKGGNPLSYPTKFVPHYSTLVGEVYRRHTDTTNISGYQVLRFITEILPAALTLSTAEISWVWTLILFMAFFLFGLSQLCVMWKPISCAFGNSSSAVLMSCATGLLLGTPFITEIGISILHYMDILLGGAWFIPILWSAEIFGIFLIRGRPYNGDDLVNDLKMSGSMSAFLALSWNILLPIGLITLAIIEYKISQSNQFYFWHGKSYFSYWSRKVGALTQIGFLLLVPISAIVQIYRYLASGPPDILDRIQLLYRPLEGDEQIQTNLPPNRNISTSDNENMHNSSAERLQNDAPPKYTPPPSYSTATGAKLAKILRQSIRRSVRRILGESGALRPNDNRPEQMSCSTSHNVETTDETAINISHSLENENRPSGSLIYGRSLSLGRNQILNKNRFKDRIIHPLSGLTNNNSLRYNRRFAHQLYNRPFTAEDVKTILRSSTLGRRRSPRLGNLQFESSFRSIESLVQSAEPPHLSSSMEGHVNINNEYITSEI